MSPKYAPYPPYPPYPPYAPYPPYPPYPAQAGCCPPVECQPCCPEPAADEPDYVPPVEEPAVPPSSSSASATSGSSSPSAESQTSHGPSASSRIEQPSSGSASSTPAGSGASSASAASSGRSSAPSSALSSGVSSGVSSASPVSSSSSAPGASSSSSSTLSSSSSATSSSSIGRLAPSGQFAVSRIDLEAFEFCHKGTGSHTTTKLVVDPATVPGTGKLAFVSRSVHVTTMLFQLDADEKPNWFGVAVPDGITDFTRPTLYFHPTTSPPRYVEAAYFGKQKDAASRTPDESRWCELFEYVDRLGHQLGAAVQHFGASPDQVLIMPFMPASKMGTAGILPAHWLPIVTDILIQVRAAVTGVMAPLAVSEVVLAGYSAGFGCMMALRNSANQSVLNPLLKQIWDFDGFPKATSIPVISTPAVKVIKYAENPQQQALLLGLARWSEFPKAPPELPDEEPELPTPVDTFYAHHLIRDCMYLDAAVKRGPL